jgi:hypothetical protein
MLINIFSNCLIIWSIELSKNNSLSRFSFSKRDFFWCYTLKKNLFYEYIFFKRWNLIKLKNNDLQRWFSNDSFFYFRNFQNRDKISTYRHCTMLIKTINIKWLFLNELFIYRKNNNERINKNFIFTKISKVHQSIKIRRCRVFNQNRRMRLNKIFLY